MKSTPFREALEAVCHKAPPDFVTCVKSSGELSDNNFLRLQDWCCNHAKPQWALGLSMIEAADRIVKDAILNGNLRIEAEPRDKYLSEASGSNQ